MNGEKGANVLVGPDREIGNRGATGPPGAKGTVGTQGHKGLPGPDVSIIQE